VALPQPDSPLTRALHAAADASAPELAREARTWLEALRESVSHAALGAVWRARRTWEVITLPAWSELPAPGRPATGFQARAQAILERVSRDAGSAVMEARLDVINPLAEAAARQHAARLVTGVSRESQRAISDTVARAVAGRLNPDQAAGEIRQVIGLNRRQASSLVSYRRGLIEAGRSPGMVDRLSERQYKRLLRERSVTIARTETMRSAVSGSEAIWIEQTARGVIPRTAVKQWSVVADDRTCHVCRPLDGIIAPVGGTFVEAGVDNPPLHPRCRCVCALVLE
jgi:SPP1 gp7 family putative phage head morphogenesis protein